MSLPKEIRTNIRTIGYEGDPADIEAIEEYISDWLSDEYGFCHYGFTVEVGTESRAIVISDIEWDTNE